MWSDYGSSASVLTRDTSSSPGFSRRPHPTCGPTWALAWPSPCLWWELPGEWDCLFSILLLSHLGSCVYSAVVPQQSRVEQCVPVGLWVTTAMRPNCWAAGGLGGPAYRQQWHWKDREVSGSCTPEPCVLLCPSSSAGVGGAVWGHSYPGSG